MKRILFLFLAVMSTLQLAATDSFSVRLMTYSIRHGLDAAGNDNLEGQAAVIEKYDADFVALQAVDNGVTRSGKINQAQVLAEHNGMVSTFARAITIDGGEYGVALLSKATPINVQRIALDYSGEDRVLLVCEFADCIVATTHLSSTASEQQTAVNTLVSIAEKSTKPFFLAGLLNCDPGSAVLTEVQNHFTLLNDKFTANKPAGTPTKCASYIGLFNTNGYKATTLSQEVGNEPSASDYRPLIVSAKVEEGNTTPTPDVTTEIIPEPTGDVRLMSYNIRHGSDINKEMNLEEQMEIMRKWNPDYIMLQEVDSMCTRSGRIYEAQVLADGLGMHATFARAIDFEGGKYGVALLSREKPLSVERYPLPNNSEARVLLVCEFEDKYVACTHLSYERNEHETPVSIINGAARKATKPFFIGGDWNDEPQSTLLNTLRETFTILSDDYVLSYPADVPTMCIDYIAAFNNEAVRQPVVTLQHLANEPTASDHRPLIIDFRWQGASKCQTPQISLAQGKIKFSCATKGAQFHYTIESEGITDAGVAASEVSLNTEYRITVYATAAGCQQSDVATKTFTLADLHENLGDMNGDGRISVADVSELVRKVLEK